VTDKPLKRCDQCDRPLLTDLEETRCVLCTESEANTTDESPRRG